MLYETKSNQHEVLVASNIVSSHTLTNYYSDYNYLPCTKNVIETLRLIF